MFYINNHNNTHAYTVYIYVQYILTYSLYVFIAPTHTLPMYFRHTGREEEALIKKLYKNCNQPFETSNSRRETCSDKCRSAFSRRKKVTIQPTQNQLIDIDLDITDKCD